MSRTFRTVAGLFLILLGIIGALLPIIPGFVFFAAAAGVLGTDHAIVRWGWKWLAYFKILKPQDQMPEGPPPADGNPPKAS